MIEEDSQSLSEPKLYTYSELLEQYQKERGPNSPQVIRLGFGTLDADMRGVSPGQVCGIAARTAVGKTWALNTVEYNLSAGGIGVLSLSLEMPGLEWAERALSVSQDIAPEQVEAWARDGRLADFTASFLSRSRSVLVCDEDVSIGQLPELTERARKRIPLRVVLVDYLGLLGAPGRDSYERSSAIGKGLKMFAKQQQVAILVAMQLSRAAGDGSQAVTLDMLRDSGVLEESLDFMIGCWRPGRDTRQDESVQLALQDVMRCRLLKNRKGQDGREIDLTFREHSRKLVEITDPFEGL